MPLHDCSNSSLGMAGLAEGAMAMALMLEWGALLISLVCLIVALVRKSPVLLGVSIGVLIVMTFFFTPWAPFVHATSQDLDDVYWTGQFRVAGVAWALISVGAAASFPVITRACRRRFQTDSTNAGRGFPVIQDRADGSPPMRSID